MSDINETNHLTTAQVADLLHVSPQTVRDWTAAGKINATVTPGGHRRYTSKDAYLAYHSANGIERYWVEDMALRLDSTGEIDTDFGNDPDDRYNNRALADASGETLARLTTGAYIAHPLAPGDLHIMGDRVALYIQAYALTKIGAREALHANIAAASAWLRENARPATTITWVTKTGQQIEPW